MHHNISEVAELHPEYLGFIFYPKSPRFFGGTIPLLPDSIKKVGVFVNADPDLILNTVAGHGLNVIQLHGDETPGYCETLRRSLDSHFSSEEASIPLWKAFGVSSDFDFEQLKIFEPLADAFLFDTKSASYGGTGKTFDWSLLQQYDLTTPIILSGGIGMEQLPHVKDVLLSDLPILALDLNSRFERAPGNKDVQQLQKFIRELRTTVDLE